MLNDHEIQSIIARVRGRVAAADGQGSDGKVLRAADDLGAVEAHLGDGIHPSVDAAVGAASRAFDAYRELGLESRRVIVEAMRAAMLRDGERLAYMAHAGQGSVEPRTRCRRI